MITLQCNHCWRTYTIHKEAFTGHFMCPTCRQRGLRRFYVLLAFIALCFLLLIIAAFLVTLCCR